MRGATDRGDQLRIGEQRLAARKQPAIGKYRKSVMNNQYEPVTTKMESRSLVFREGITSSAPAC